MRFAVAISLYRRLSAAGFLIGFLLMGCVMTFTMPPFQIPDEGNHWEAALGKIERATAGTVRLSEWRKLPDSFDVHRIKTRYKEKMRRGVFEQLTFNPNASRINPIAYSTIFSYPQTILAVALSGPGGRDNPFRALSVFYLARLLGGLLVLVPLIRLSCLAPKPGLLTLLAFSTLGLFVQQSFTVSADAVCNAFTVWMLVAVLARGRLAKPDWIAFTFYGVMAISTKPVLLVPALAALIYVRRQQSRDGAAIRLKRPLLFIAGIGTIATVAYLLRENPFDARFAINNALAMISRITVGFIERIGYFRQMGAMGWLDFRPSDVTYKWWMALVAIAVAADTAVWKRSADGRLSNAAILVAGAFAYAFSFGILMFMLFHHRQEPFFNFLQPRYFFPSVFLLIAALFTFADTRFTEQTIIGISAKEKFVVNIWSAFVGLCFFSYLTHQYIDIAKRYW